ncbi:nucleoside hydrolase-like domain-containing protein [Micromonospora sp. LOL_024]|uniref:nucleoside hydrolase-like domain-containing protein n=1 Tax=Micromonospora sp. LOL_024 TaxID=3345412 RepID=UPI003A8A63A2
MRLTHRIGVPPSNLRRGAIAATALVVASTAALAGATQASAAAGCRVDYSVTSQWSGGFGATIGITNLGDPITSGWTLRFSFGAGQTIDQLWNGVVSQSGSNVTITNASYNGNLATNATVTPGFNGTWNGSNPEPTSFTLNGTACTGSVTPTTAPPTTAPPPTTPPPTTPPPTTPPPTTPPPTTPPPTPTPTGPSGAVWAVNPGGSAFTSSDGTAFVADAGFSGGSTYSNSVPINGTTDDTLFQSERYGDFTYTAPVPNGTYVVSLYFAETYHTAAGMRSFDVLMEGTERISDLDIYAQAGASTAYVTQTNVAVGDGAINLQFRSNVENAKINAIKVSTVANPGDPVASFTVTPSNPAPGDTVTVDASASFDLDGTITGYRTDFGNGTTATGAVTTHQYQAAGSYTITVTVTDNSGRTNSSAKTVTVQAPPPASAKPRVINLTDLGADPDDLQSLVRMLVTANEVDIEGIIATTGCWRTTQSTSNMNSLLNPRLNAYGQVLGNLQRHASGYPSLSYLQSISKLGQPGYGMADVGAGKDSAGSELIIAAVDKNDPRPVWVNVWGGGNTLAQAVWKVRNTRSQAALNQFISKLRVYDVLGQDDAGVWLTKNFPDLLYIRAKSLVYSWQPSDSWLDSNVQNHGALGAQYPDRKYATEGDTPSFMHQLAPGLTDPSRVDWGGWGGRFGPAEKTAVRGMSCNGRLSNEPSFDPYYMYSDASDGGSSISRWSTAIHNDFAARMDWTITGSFSGANHHPVAVVNGDTSKRILEISANAGSTVNLNATGSSDPDGNSLAYSWSYYDEPSTHNGSVTINNSTAASATVQVPSNASGKNLHVILTLRDNGSPNLYSYRRVIINVR